MGKGGCVRINTPGSNQTRSWLYMLDYETMIKLSLNWIWSKLLEKLTRLFASTRDYPELQGLANMRRSICADASHGQQNQAHSATSFQLWSLDSLNPNNSYPAPSERTYKTRIPICRHPHPHSMDSLPPTAENTSKIMQSFMKAFIELNVTIKNRPNKILYPLLESRRNPIPKIK